MKTALALLLLLNASVLVSKAVAQVTGTTNVIETVRFAWDQNTPEENVVAYRIYFGQSPTVWTHAKDVPGDLSEASIQISAPGTWFFTISARDSSGNVSDLAPVVSYSVDASPGTVRKFRIIGSVRTTQIQTSETLIMVP